MAKINAYSRTCEILASTRSQGLVSAVRSGTGFIQRHTRRTTASMRMVMPNDLCQPSAWNFGETHGRLSARCAITHWLMISSTMIQCSALEREPQERVVLRMGMSLS